MFIESLVSLRMLYVFRDYELLIFLLGSTVIHNTDDKINLIYSVK